MPLDHLCNSLDVSGTDGRDYPSECDLHKTACERRETALNVRYLGHCNPCQTLSCDAPQVKATPKKSGARFLWKIEVL